MMDSFKRIYTNDKVIGRAEDKNDVELRLSLEYTV